MRKRRLALALSLAVTALAGCDILEWLGEDSDTQAVSNTAEEVRRAQNLEPVDEAGSIDPAAAANLAQRQLTGTTGDPEVDAILESSDVVDMIEEADQWMAVGRQNRDDFAMHQALSRRPDDRSYLLSYAVLKLEQGDMGSATSLFDRADEQVLSLYYPERELQQHHRQNIDELEAAWDAVEIAIKNSPGQNEALCRAYFGRLAGSYSFLALNIADLDREYYSEMAWEYRESEKDCLYGIMRW